MSLTFLAAMTLVAATAFEEQTLKNSSSAAQWYENARFSELKTNPSPNISLAQEVLKETIQKIPNTLLRPRVTERPSWDFLGRWFPFIGNFFTRQENRAIDEYNLYSEHKGTLRAHPTDLMPLPSIIWLADFRAWMLLLGIFTIVLIVSGAFKRDLLKIANLCIPTFSFIFISAVLLDGCGILLGIITYMLVGNYSYFISSSNLWYGETAMHFYVFLAEVVIAFIILLYLRQIDFCVGQRAIDLVDGFTNLIKFLLFDCAAYLAMAGGFYTLLIYIAEYIIPASIGYYVSMVIGARLWMLVVWLITLINSLAKFLLVVNHYRITSGIIAAMHSILYYMFASSIPAILSRSNPIVAILMMFGEFYLNTYMLTRSKGTLGSIIDRIKFFSINGIRFRGEYRKGSRVPTVISGTEKASIN